MNSKRVPTGGVEEDWARLWDKLDLEWEYEPHTLRLSDKSAYSPDFYFPQLNLFVEVTAVRDLNRKNRKLKQARKLFPEYQFLLLTRHDHRFVFQGRFPEAKHYVEAMMLVRNNLATLLGFLPHAPLVFGHA